MSIEYRLTLDKETHAYLSEDTGLKIVKWIHSILHETLVPEMILSQAIQAHNGPLFTFQTFNNFYGQSHPFRCMIHSRRDVVSYKRKYVHKVG